jgi:hypothetical protein
MLHRRILSFALCLLVFAAFCGAGLVGRPSTAPAQKEDPQLQLMETIRGDHPERLFELLKTTAAPLSDNRRQALLALANYRLGDFDAAEGLLSRMDRDAPDTGVVESLLSATSGRLQEAEKSGSAAWARRSELGLLAFEAGLHLSYLLQHLGRPAEAAAVVEQLIPEAPYGRPALRNIAKNLKAAPGEPYHKESEAGGHTVPLLADGSTPSRAVLTLRPNEPGQLALFDTGSTLNLLRADVRRDVGTGTAVLALDAAGNMEVQYGWQRSLSVGGWKLENVPVGFVEKSAENSAMGNYGAVFGLPFLRRFFLVFDFPRRSMELLPFAPDKVEGDRISFRYAADQLIIRGTMNGKAANLLLDTGLALPSVKVDLSWGTILAPSPVSSAAVAAPSEKRGGKKKRQEDQAPYKSEGAVAIEIRSLKFGAQEMAALPVTVTSLRGRLAENPLAVRIDAILGAPQLSGYRISIDFQNSWIYFQRRQDAK